MAILVIDEGAGRVRRHALAEGFSAVAGRDPACEIRFDDPQASRRHFQIKEHRGAFYIRDLSSQNGTLVNGTRLERPVRLGDGDEIRAGGTIFRFEAPPPKGAAEGDRTARPRRVIGGYEILERIGRGGMGVVYRATQLSLGRDVALKLLSHTLTTDETFVKRFIEEARAAGRLNHPNIVQVYDVASEGDRYFISMELMERGSVEDLLREEGKLSSERAVTIMLDAARGLQYAEAKKIVHRDIKPDNLMINADGVVKIADLGLAKSLHEPAKGDDDEGILGTPHFISPEQARGLEVDTRSDIYSLGATFYRIVTGETPFQGSSAKEIVLQQIQEEPRPVREVAPEVPDDVAGVIERMMQKDPARRPPSAAALLEELERVQRAHHYGRRPSRARRLLGIAAVLALALVGIRLLFPPTSPGRASPPRPGPQGAAAPRVPDDRDQQALLESRANEAFLAVQLREQGAGRTPEVAAGYRDVARHFPGTRAARKSATRAEEIDREISERREQERERQRRARERAARIDGALAAARAALDREGRVGGGEAAGEDPRFGEELARALAAPGLAEMLGSEAHREAFLDLLARHVEGAEGFAQRVLDRAASLAARAAWDEAETALAEGAKRFDPLPEAVAPDAPGADLLARYGLARRRLEERLAEVRQGKRRALLARDRDRFFPAARSVLRDLLPHSRYAAALGVLAPVRELLETAEYREQLDRLLGDVQAMAALKRTLVAAVNDQGLAAIEVPLGTPVEGTGAGHPVEADEEGLVLRIRIRTGQIEERVSWEDLPAEILLRFVGAEALGGGTEQGSVAILVLVYRGDLARAREAFDRWNGSGGGGGGGRERLARLLEREAEARRLREEGSRLYAQKKWARALEALRRLRDEFADTREALLHSDGTSHYFGEKSP